MVDYILKEGVCLKLHILRCGTMRVSETIPFGDAVSLANTRRQLLTPDSKRVTLPNFCFLLEHPQGLYLIDTGWCREISPKGDYDARAVRSVLPAPLAALYHPQVEEGMTAREQLAAMGICPEDLAGVLITHLDADNTVSAPCAAQSASYCRRTNISGPAARYTRLVSPGVSGRICRSSAYTTAVPRWVRTAGHSTCLATRVSRW